ncbi:MAG: hypothetical protein KDD78_21040, partial [Caldilineaceae bacterium]|nr:hypothetical protein [Caldilineaceae bacterium]
LAQTTTTGVPLLSPVDESSTDAEPGSVQVGAAIQTLDVVRLRQTPGYVAKPPADVIANLSLNQPGTVVAGPLAKDELIWWEIRTIDGDQNGLQGWVAEFDPTGARLIESTGDGPESPAQGGTEVSGGGAPPGSESPSAFRVGDAVVTLDYVRLRKSPGYVDKDADDVVADLAINTPGTVRGGPQPADDLTWWRLDTTAPDGRAVNGWAAQSAPNGADLLRLDDNPPPSGQEPDPGVGGPGRFDVDDRLVTLDFVRFRRTPGYVGKEASDLIQDVPPRAAAIVLGGPIEMDGLTWWQVRVPLAGAEGWMAEMSPTGLLLLSPELGSGPPDDNEFVRGELVQAADALRVRQSPGTENKPGDDVLGEFAPQTTLNIIDGPRMVDGLTWWQVGGISLLQGELVGWVAQAAANGTTLMQRAAQLPGTNIPDRDAGRYLTAPFRGRFGIAQLWGENQAIYNNFHYDGVALKGHN